MPEVLRSVQTARDPVHCTGAEGHTTSHTEASHDRLMALASLLIRLVDGCPLASMRELPEADSNPHVLNLTASIHRPLYMECKFGSPASHLQVCHVLLRAVPDVLGHPFGKVPSPKAFEGSSKEASVILTDPRNPVGKELLAGELCAC